MGNFLLKINGIQKWQNQKHFPGKNPLQLKVIIKKKFSEKKTSDKKN